MPSSSKSATTLLSPSEAVRDKKWMAIDSAALRWLRAKWEYDVVEWDEVSTSHASSPEKYCTLMLSSRHKTSTVVPLAQSPMPVSNNSGGFKPANQINQIGLDLGKI